MPLRFRKADVARFWSKVAQVEGDGCWEWQTANGPAQGYSTFTTSRRGWVRRYTAHRLAYELTNGRIRRRGLYVCHHCDNPPCCRPDHLFLGTPTENQQDMMNKGRWFRGTVCGHGHPLAKITTEMMAEIRASFLAGQVTAADVAAQHGLKWIDASDLCRGRWKRALTVKYPQSA